LAGLLVCVAARAWAAEPVKLQTTDLGSGPAIVFVTDVGAARTGWMPVARRLVGGHRVVLVDLPGHGGGGLPEPFSLEAAADALVAVLNRPDLDSAVVVGRGVGGMLAAIALGDQPARARGLVLVDVSLRVPSTVPDQQKKQFLAWMDENYDLFLKMTYGASGRDSAESAENLAVAMQVPAVTMKSFFRALLDADVSATFKNYDRPVLYVGSSRQWPSDKAWPTFAQERGLEGVANPDTLRLPGTWNQTLKENPDTLAKAIAAFGSQARAR
jgi:pimeloyl-ACP methyl ester carboxylesterase